MRGERIVAHTERLLKRTGSPAGPLLNWFHQFALPSASDTLLIRGNKPQDCLDIVVNLFETAAQLANCGKLLRYLIETVFNNGQPSLYVVVRPANRFADSRNASTLQKCDQM